MICGALRNLWDVSVDVTSVQEIYIKGQMRGKKVEQYVDGCYGLQEERTMV